MTPSKNEPSGTGPVQSNNSTQGARETNVDGNGTTSLIFRLIDPLLTLLIPGLILAHLIVAPYTKVEESFNIQAAHDVLVYGMPTANIHKKLSTTYDHFTFPGAVPRTFVGPVMLAGLGQPIIGLVGFQHAQLIVRAILGLFNAGCMLDFAKRLRRAYGAGISRFYLLLQGSQFHVIFYASRTLPNMFAFGLTTLAFSFLLPDPTSKKPVLYQQRLSITLFVFAAAIFRSEVALLLGATVFHQLVIPTISLERVIFPFAASFLVSLAISVPLDSYFWQQPIWPELWGFYFNVVHGNASNWGVSPWHYYFTSALPRLLINPLTYVLLIPYALYHPATARAASRLVVPSLLFTAIYSFQPHKEARFIFYVVPPLTAAAALGANRLFLNAAGSSHQSKSKPTSPFSILLAILILLSITASFAASTAMLAISALNYPGGEALTYLRTTILRDPSTTAAAVTTNNSEHPGIVTVHADVLSCMTGVTLFGSSTATSLSDAAAHAFAASAALKKPTTASSEEDSDSDSKPIRIPSSQQQQQNPVPQLAVDKTESPSLLNSPDFWNRFDYLLTEDPSRIPSLTNPDNNQEGEYEWYTLATIQGYAGIEILRPGQQEPSDNDETNGGSKNIVGHGRTVARLRRLVRNSGLTKGWWVGPRMKDRVYILQKKRKSTPRSERVEDERGKKRRAVDAR